MSYPRPIKIYHIHANLIWPDDTFNAKVIFPLLIRNRTLTCISSTFNNCEYLKKN